MTKLLRALVLAVTGLALLATSTAHRSSCPPGPIVPGPTVLAVDTTCGPPGAVTASVDPETCTLAIDAAADVGLPSRGTLDEAVLWLQEGDSPRFCKAEEGPAGEWTVRCYESHGGGALGCGGGDLPVCRGVLRVAPP
jgi:hypothetical protein